MTLEDFFNLKEKQNSCCAICNTKLAENKDIHVDHCHTTGMVRGLLCRGCNLGLGNFFDNIQALTEAIKYLQKYAPQTP